MKRRYVFLLTIAAAALGAAVTHYWPMVESFLSHSLGRQTSAAQDEAVRWDKEIQRHYRNIADALGVVCQLEYKNGYSKNAPVFVDWLRETEKGWIDEAASLQGNDNVVRLGPRLVIKTKGRDIDIIDVGYFCHSPYVALHRYKGKLSKIGWHIVEISYYEGAPSTFLISPETGETVFTFGRLEESPSGLRIAAYFSEEAEGGGFEILRRDGNKLISELNSGQQPNARHVLFAEKYLLEVVGWVDEETLLVLLNNNERATLVRREGKWQFQKPSP